MGHAKNCLRKNNLFFNKNQPRILSHHRISNFINIVTGIKLRNELEYISLSLSPCSLCLVSQTASWYKFRVRYKRTNTNAIKTKSLFNQTKYCRHQYQFTTQQYLRFFIQAKLKSKTTLKLAYFETQILENIKNWTMIPMQYSTQFK